jgi:hypothetical protein
LHSSTFRCVAAASLFPGDHAKASEAYPLQAPNVDEAPVSAVGMNSIKREPSGALFYEKIAEGLISTSKTHPVLTRGYGLIALFEAV